jgi:hypothetical membrane protein
MIVDTLCRVFGILYSIATTLSIVVSWSNLPGIDVRVDVISTFGINQVTANFFNITFTLASSFLYLFLFTIKIGDLKHRKKLRRIALFSALGMAGVGLFPSKGDISLNRFLHLVGVYIYGATLAAFIYLSRKLVSSRTKAYFLLTAIASAAGTPIVLVLTSSRMLAQLWFFSITLIWILYVSILYRHRPSELILPTNTA